MISESVLTELLLDINEWPKTFDSLGNQSGTCDTCEIAIPTNISSEIILPHFLLMEFSTALSEKFNFFDTMEIKDCSYRLSALVRHRNAHFTCAILSGNKWNYFDDMKQNSLVY